MAVINIIIALMGLAFGYEGLMVLKAADTSIHQVYGGTMLGAGGIILALAATIMAIAFPEKR